MLFLYKIKKWATVSDRLSKKLKLFCTCTLLSGLLWLALSYSQEHIYVARCDLSYESLPLGVHAGYQLPTHALLYVKGSFWESLWGKIQMHRYCLTVDLAGLGHVGEISLLGQLPQLYAHGIDSNRIKAIRPQTIAYELKQLSVKKVPLQAHITVKFAQNYDYAGPLQLLPDSIVLIGPDESLKAVTHVQMPALHFDHLKDSVKEVIPLGMLLSDPNISTSTAYVQLIIPVEQYTEQTVAVQPKVRYNAEDFSITLIPRQVQIKYHVPLSYYTKVHPEDFAVSVDLNQWKKQGHTELRVELSKQPDFVHVQRMHPACLDFLVNK